MNLGTFNLWRLIVVAVVLLSAVAACKDDPMQRGRQAYVAEKADEAEAAFNEVLKADPNNFEARRLLADVHRFRGDFEKTEQELEKLWQEKSFDQPSKDLSVEDRVARDHMENQFAELYAKWTAQIDPREEPEKFERVVRKGLERQPKSPPLNRMLVEFYLERGEKLAEEQKPLEAAQAYEKVLGLRALPQQRKDAEERAKLLRRQAFEAEAKQRLEEEVIPKYRESEAWDAEKKAFVVRVEAEVDRKLRPRNEEDRKRAQAEAAKPFAFALRDLTLQVGNLPENADFSKVGVPKNTVVEEDFKRGKYVIVATVAPDDVMKTAFAVSEQVRTAQDEGDAGEKKAAAAEDGATAAAADEATPDAGTQTP